MWDVMFLNIIGRKTLPYLVSFADKVKFWVNHFS